MLRNAMTVDVEDYFQVSAMEPYVARENWEKTPLRVERNTETVLQLFSDAGIRATFFTLGWVAERCPALIKRIVDNGHELASHGYEHTRAHQQNREQFAADVRKTKTLLEDMAGVSVTGYRAASYSITRANLWALDELAAAGYRYSSSIYPVHHDLYGIPDAPRQPFFPARAPTLLEVPVTTAQFGSRNVPAGGGGYFRLFPYALSRKLIERVNRRDQMSAVFYFHPWEIDPAQPRPNQLDLRTRVRHYLNLRRMAPRLQRLLSDFQWGRMDEIFLPQSAPTIDLQ
ncbi:XrtA system polysaccharide deacetylase [Permianibacter fluminis]|uniref:XrtA system polysaccharide deacetylase n=1 Tax=Permianibacter fluminis TaxID=2738515 RepID=UPI001B7D849B|nr:XrtA system polysaccharide deacetylase [Permianibacter fluminis]